MEVDKKSYTVGETVELKGSVKNLNEGKNEVRLDLYNSEGKVLTSDILVPLDGNKFSRQRLLRFKAHTQVNMLLRLTYGEQTGNITYKVTA